MGQVTKKEEKRGWESFEQAGRFFAGEARRNAMDEWMEAACKTHGRTKEKKARE